MGRYGVEEQFWVGDYRFEVNASSDYAGGHGPPDIWVAHRKTLEDLARTSFTGPQLLGAYDGPDQNMRKEALAQRLDRPVGSYREASRLHGQMPSQSVTSNTQVRQDLLTVAGELRARWLR